MCPIRTVCYSSASTIAYGARLGVHIQTFFFFSFTHKKQSNFVSCFSCLFVFDIFISSLQLRTHIISYRGYS
ncbi:hypothetical protein HOY82DRAFT_550981 [Tuber indicum]|nr:hypothetical protein HOY82DRAFT_550981 [Tuber indicum]